MPTLRELTEQMHRLPIATGETVTVRGVVSSVVRKRAGEYALFAKAGDFVFEKRRALRRGSIVSIARADGITSEAIVTRWTPTMLRVKVLGGR